MAIAISRVVNDQRRNLRFEFFVFFKGFLTTFSSSYWCWFEAFLRGTYRIAGLSGDSWATARLIPLSKLLKFLKQLTGSASASLLGSLLRV
jgi:hypothetical protein